jgi:hypothetical protein
MSNKINNVYYSIDYGTMNIIPALIPYAFVSISFSRQLSNKAGELCTISINIVGG